MIMWQCMSSRKKNHGSCVIKNNEIVCGPKTIWQFINDGDKILQF